MDEINKGITYLAVDFLGYKTENKLWPLFSTISVNLEPNGWGTKYPFTLKKFCDSGIVKSSELYLLKKEILDIDNKLKKLKIKDIYLDFDNINDKIVCEKEEQYNEPMINYFTKKEGGNLIETILKAISDASELNVPLQIKSL
jgi:hypothetical protein